MNFKKINKWVLIFAWIAVLLWMTLIFSLSAQPAHQSNKLSKGVTRVIVETVEKITAKKDLDYNRLNHIVRKNTHFMAYFILGILVISGLRFGRITGFKSYAIAFAVCVLYAISDETHQYFVPGRGAQVTDVLIDSAGAFTGIGIYFLTGKAARMFSLNKEM